MNRPVFLSFSPSQRRDGRRSSLDAVASALDMWVMKHHSCCCSGVLSQILVAIFRSIHHSSSTMWPRKKGSSLKRVGVIFTASYDQDIEWIECIQKHDYHVETSFTLLRVMFPPLCPPIILDLVRTSKSARVQQTQQTAHKTDPS